MDEQCLHEGNGKCHGELTVVENPITFRRFVMCQKHADKYYRIIEDTIQRYPEVLNPESEEDYRGGVL